MRGGKGQNEKFMNFAHFCEFWCFSLGKQARFTLNFFLKFRRVTIRGAEPSARLSEEICLSEASAGVSERAPRGLSEGSAGSLRGSAGFCRGTRDFPRVFGGSDPMLVTLGNCWAFVPECPCEKFVNGVKNGKRHANFRGGADECPEG